MERIGVPVTF